MFSPHVTRPGKGGVLTIKEGREGRRGAKSGSSEVNVTKTGIWSGSLEGLVRSPGYFMLSWKSADWYTLLAIALRAKALLLGKLADA